MKKSSSKVPEKLEVYKTKQQSNKDLYLVLLLTLASLTVFIIPLNRYLTITIISSLSVFLSFLIIFLLGYVFWATLFPLAKIGKFKRLILVIIFEIVLITTYFFIFNINPLNGYNIKLLIILSILIGLLSMISFLRRKEENKFEKKESKDESLKHAEFSSTNNNLEENIYDITHNRIKKSEVQKVKKIVSWDIILIFIATLMCIVIITSPKLNGTIEYIYSAIFIMLVLPGYSLVAALYPRKGELNIVQRASLSFGFPLTILAFGILINNINPIAISLPFIIVLLATFTLVFIIVAYLRRRRISGNENLEINFKSYPAEEEFDSESSPHKTSQKIVVKELHEEKNSKPKYFAIDLLLIFFITIFTIITILTPKLSDTLIRTILGLVLILFIPGYSLLSALFPKKSDISGIERIALSFGLSIAVTPLLGLILNYTPYGIRLTPILFILSTFTILMVTIALIRRTKVTNDEKFYVNFGFFIKSLKNIFQKKSKMHNILIILLILSIILAISTAVFVVVKPKQGESFTEFYILGSNGQASDYPTNITVGQNASVIIGIVNHEYKTVNYNLVVTTNGNVMTSQNITLSEGDKVEIPYKFSETKAGQKDVEFSLYKLPDNTNVYRSLHLFVNVR